MRSSSNIVNIRLIKNKHTRRNRSSKHVGSNIKTKTKGPGATTRNNRVTKKRVYDSEHYQSGDGMLTNVWGPSLWHVLHTMSFNYPVEPTSEQKRQYKKFVLDLQYVLPCKYCRINLVSNLKDMPLTNDCMKSRNTFSMYIYNLHEVVNKMLGKKSGLTYDDVRERYEHFRARCGKNKEKLFKFSGKKTKKHRGCTEPVHKVKSKGVIHIVPQNTKCDSIIIDNKCVDVK
jgi:hypothetical protein